MNKLVKVLSLTGVAGVGFYFLQVFFGTILYPDYNSFAQAISDLTALNSPSRYIAMPLSVVYGIFTVIFSIYFFIYSRKYFSVVVTLGAGFFCAVQVISFFGYMLFPLTEDGYAGTFQDRMHMAVTALVVFFTIVSLILFMIGFLKTRGLKYLSIVTLFTFLILLVGAILINILPNEYFGIAQRINVFSIVIYTGVLSFWMYRYKNP